jgi:hypothetical protein
MGVGALAESVAAELEACAAVRPVALLRAPARVAAGFVAGGEDGTAGVVAGAESEDFIELAEGESRAVHAFAGVESRTESGVGHRGLA